jgi:MYXO-CTERM domain-containing protein
MRALHRCSLAFVLSLALFAAIPRASAQAPLLDTYGGALGYGTSTLPGNDDGSTSVIDLTEAFPMGLNFFGGPYFDVYVNNNGNITFNGPVGTFTPDPFPVADQPMIAPYWGDVDTRGGGAPEENGVFWHMAPGLMVVTWHNVGYYYIHDDLKMDFQLILRNALDCTTGDFDVEFRYNRCEWTTGDASDGKGGFGGTPAQAGFDAGNGTDYVEIDGSRTMAILDLCTSSNVGEDGVWRFSVRSGEVVCPGTGAPCETGMNGACGVGVTQCVGGGIVCSQIGSPSAERCDGVDNDCDGTTDGAGLCADPGHICWRGECVPPCFEGGCDEGYACSAEGACIDEACASVTCAAGERCSRGVCIGACEGVVCPYGQQCLAGRCSDLCDFLTCGEGEVCYDGACVPQCPCRTCPDGDICRSDGSCEPAGCSLTTCDAGFHCRNGECLDSCDGAVCPAGQHCEVGECIDDPPVTLTPPDAGPPPAIPDASFTATEPDAGRDEVRRRAGNPGCGCRAASSDTSDVWIFGALALFAWSARRRRAR